MTAAHGAVTRTSNVSDVIRRRALDKTSTVIFAEKPNFSPRPLKVLQILLTQGTNKVFMCRSTNQVIKLPCERDPAVEA